MNDFDDFGGCLADYDYEESHHYDVDYHREPEEVDYMAYRRRRRRHKKYSKSSHEGRS